MVDEQARAETGQRMETLRLPPAAPPTNHGQTTAAWTTTLIVLVGATVAGLGMIVATVWLFWVGLGVTILGLVVGKVMQVLGHGQGGARTLAAQRSAHH
jgi:hypothetical protein